MIITGRCKITIDGIEFHSAEPAIIHYGGAQLVRRLTWDDGRRLIGIGTGQKDAATLKRRAKNKAARRARRRNRS